MIWAAYSGGLDSHVLLHLLQQLPLAFPLTAVHVNHGLSVHANEWDAHCEAVCQQLNIPYQSIAVCAKAKRGESPEAAARVARYEALSACLSHGDYLCTAHHQDDQAETVLLQLLRGAGPKGLAAMPMMIPFAKGYLWRPLLDFSQESLLQYAKKHQLSWIEDDSNQNMRFKRNLIRQRIIPELKNDYPAVTRVLSRTAAHCAEASELLTEFAAADLKKMQPTLNATLSMTELLKLSVARQKNVLRYWLNSLQLPSLSEAQMERLQRDVINARQDACPVLRWAHVEMRRYRELLYVMPQKKIQGHWVFVEQVNGIRELAIDEWEKVSVRFRQGGEVFHSHCLKKLWQTWGVPPWRRGQIPLVFYEDQLIAVAGFGVHPAYQVPVGEIGWGVFY